MPEWDEPDVGRQVSNWLLGMSASDAALMRSLPKRRRDLVTARLAAVLEAESGGNLSELAERLGVDRIAFFRLRQRWARDRSLRSLTPFATRAVRAIASGHLQPVVDRAIHTLRDDPDIPTSKLADQLRDTHGMGISRQTALRIAREALANLSADEDHLSGGLGRKLLVDLCGTKIEYRSVDGSIGTIAVAIVVEVASRIILGAAAGDAMNGLVLQLEAVRAARDAFGEFEPSRSLPSEVVVVLAPNIEPFFPSTPTGMSLIAKGERRFGQRLVSLVGHRLLRLQLRPRKTLSRRRVSDNVDTPSIDGQDGSALAMSAIQEYNADRRDVLAAGVGGISEIRDAFQLIGLIDIDGSRRSAIARCLDDVGGWLEELALRNAKLRQIRGIGW